jgi:hypothetical protein
VTEKLAAQSYTKWKGQCQSLSGQEHKGLPRNQGPAGPSIIFALEIPFGRAAPQGEFDLSGTVLLLAGWAGLNSAVVLKRETGDVTR